ncbi:hypothetical protein LA080_001810 [Diaporthe eres]|uniref:Uncharacterized protein n=1 Tax=Diaporthe vaccinii TaxID=105482 RepID=A0ABR4F2M8_9PEZI|nr:hypothetical protein LA080_001810 [Diaporthe eres]
MENQSDNFQITIQPSEVAGRVDVVFEECLCAYVTVCMCTGEDECFCFGSKENHATSESDAVEHSGVADQSGAVEKSGGVEQASVVETYTSGATQEADAAGEDYAAEKDGAIEEIITISDEEKEATEEDTGIREHPFVGRYRLEDTSTALLWCGMFALIISTSSQLGTQITQSEFWRAYDSQEMQDFNRQNGWRNRGNFYDDQLAGVLRIWGRNHGRDNLQLGLITEGSEDVFIIGDEKFEIISSMEDMERQSDFTTVWIHNDNAQQLHGGPMNHYSGITF